MIKVMRHIEIHVVESSQDLQSAEIAGLGVFDQEFCDECSESVGDTDAGFVSFIVCLDDESEWIVCSLCAEPVL